MAPSFTSRLFTTAAILYSAFHASAAPSTRQVLETSHGILSAPSSGVVVSQGSSFPFEFQDSNWCEDGYSSISIWLTNYAPTYLNVNSTGQFSEGEYSYYFGSYLIPNFGLPVLSGNEVYLAVVETGTSCPPGLHIPPQYELTETSIIVG
ncbi:hypothetical protein C8J55DRAFT_240470 [Lentinula edodes]|uniref:Uncharacterized protein n=1 Tax=Lentinula lateritia TaxID=40482 RepID=A0A9W8ZUT5_9AGAR|nr:hypothetical protein C8J55DRAFT_240470 [Lentinula edodes]